MRTIRYTAWLLAMAAVIGTARAQNPLTSTNKPTLNVKDFGARGDGVTDDYNALRAAVAAVNSNGGGTLNFPPGTYRINRYRTATNGVLSIFFENCNGLFVNGYGARIEVKGDFHRPADLSSYQSSYNSVIPLFFRNCRNFTVQGFELDGNVEQMTRDAGISEGPSHGLATAHSSYYTIRDVYSHHFAGDGFYLGDSETNSDRYAYLERVTARHNARDGISLIAIRDISIVDSLFELNGWPQGAYPPHNPSSGLNVEAPKTAVLDAKAGNVTVLRCTIKSNRLSQLQGAGLNKENVTFRACTIDQGISDYINTVNLAVINGVIEDSTMVVQQIVPSWEKYDGTSTTIRNCMIYSDFRSITDYVTSPGTRQVVIEGNSFIGTHTAPTDTQMPFLRNVNTVFRNNTLFIPKAAKDASIAQPIARITYISRSEGNTFLTDYVSTNGSHFYADLTQTAVITGDQYPDAPFFRKDAVARLEIAIQPRIAASGSPFGVQPVVLARNESGVVGTGYRGSALMEIKPGTGTAGAVLSGTRSIGFANGEAVFQNLSIDRTGSNYILTARSDPYMVDTVAFSVASSAQLPAQFQFTRQPGGATAGSTLSQQPIVAVRDASGSTVTAYNGYVSLALKSGTGAPDAKLLGTARVVAVNGVATFSGLSVDRAGSGYVLTASNGALPPMDSAPFTITAPAPPTTDASHIKYLTHPSGATAGAPFTTQPRLVIRNLSGYTVTNFNGPITLSIKAGTGTSGARLLGTTTVNAVAGIAQFTNLAIDLAGSNYILVPSSPGLIGYDSRAFNVTAPANTTDASHVKFLTHPSGATAGAAFTTQPRLVIRNLSGYTVTNFNGPITLSIKAGTGTSGARLLGTTTVNAVAGIAQFTNLAIDLAGSNYVLLPSSPGLIGYDSRAFAVASP